MQPASVRPKAQAFWQPELPFAAFQNKTLVDLDDAGKRLFQRVFAQAQKAMSPAERQIEVCPAFALPDPTQNAFSHGLHTLR